MRDAALLARGARGVELHDGGDCMLSAAAEATEPTSPLPPDCVPAARSTNAAAAGVAKNDTIT